MTIDSTPTRSIRRWRIAAALLFVVALIAATALFLNRPAPAEATTLGSTGMAKAAAEGKLPIYVDWSGITGTPNSKHTTSFRISKFSWSITNPPALGTGSGRVTAGNVVMVKQLDQYTPALLQATAQNTDNKSVVIDIVHVDSKGKQIEALQYKISDFVVGSDAQTNSSAAQETITGEVRKIEITYFLGSEAKSTFLFEPNTP